MNVSVENPKPPPPELGIQFARGCRYALRFGVLGFVSPLVIAIPVTAYRWFASGGDAHDQVEAIGQLWLMLSYPTVGAALVFAAAAWATYAPRGPFRFAWTLVQVFLLSTLVWMTLSRAVPPVKKKDDINPLFDLLIMAIGPAIAAILLTLARCDRCWTEGPVVTRDKDDG